MQNLIASLALLVAVFGAAHAANYCPEGQKICANEIFTNCYNPETHICPYGIPCLKGLQPCGTKCYNPNEQFCAGSEPCQKGWLACNWRCQDPADLTKKCLRYEYGEQLCDDNQKLCDDGWGRKQCC